MFSRWIFYCCCLLLLQINIFSNLASCEKTKSAAATKETDTQFCEKSVACESSQHNSKNINNMAGTANERTFLAVKPDGVQRGLVGEVLKRFEQRGYKLVGLKMITPTVELLTEHYKEHIGKPFFEGLLKYMGSGPVVAMVVEGRNIITAARKMLGATKPIESAPGTLRGDFCIDTGRNLVHGSDSPESASREISLWFREDELCAWQATLSPWINE